MIKFIGARSNYDKVSGDSLGTEVCVHNYYDFPKTFGETCYIIRITDKKLRHKLPYFSTSLCANNLIGYSMTDRYSLLNMLKKYKRFRDIKEKCNCDCSSLVMTTLYRMGFTDVNVNMVTWTMIEDVKNLTQKYNFKVKIIPFKAKSQLYKGDILLSPSHHVVVVTKVVR